MTEPDFKSAMAKAVESFYSQIQGMRRGGFDAGFVGAVKAGGE